MIDRERLAEGIGVYGGTLLEYGNNVVLWRNALGEYVTHHVRDEDGALFSGHYFADEDAARADYATRTSEDPPLDPVPPVAGGDKDLNVGDAVEGQEDEVRFGIARVTWQGGDNPYQIYCPAHGQVGESNDAMHAQEIKRAHNEAKHRDPEEAGDIPPPQGGQAGLRFGTSVGAPPYAPRGGEVGLRIATIPIHPAPSTTDMNSPETNVEPANQPEPPPQDKAPRVTHPWYKQFGGGR